MLDQCHSSFAISAECALAFLHTVTKWVGTAAVTATAAAVSLQAAAEARAARLAEELAGERAGGGEAAGRRRTAHHRDQLDYNLCLIVTAIRSFASRHRRGQCALTPVRPNTAGCGGGGGG